MGRISASKVWRITMTLILTTSLTIGLSATPSSAAIVTHEVTNVGDKQFTVTWISDTAEVGQVKWGTTAEGWDASTADDDRGGATSDDTHHVTISSLVVDTDYFYKIVSGGVTYDNGGAPYQVTTGPGLAFVIPDDIATGTVYLADGTSSAEGAIVYVQITNATGTSQLLSALTEASGMWGVDITAIRKDNFQTYYDYDDIDSMTLNGQGGADGTGTTTTIVGTALTGAPNLVLALGPTVTDTVPVDSTTDVAVDTDIVVTFNVVMDPTTTEAAFSIDPVVAGARTLVDDTLTFNPTANLATDTLYTVTIADTAEDTEGRPMTADHVFSFSTDDTVPPPNPADVASTSHTLDAWSTDNNIVVTWTDSVDPTPGTGLDGYSTLWDNLPTTLPNDTKDIEDGVETLTSAALTDGTWYFHMRTVDSAENWQSAVHLGPFYIDTAAPTMEAIAEAEGQYFNSAPTFANFGFDDNMALDAISVQMDAFDGAWTTLYDFDLGTMAIEWNSDGLALPGFGALPDDSHTIYFMATDMAANAAGNDGALSWQFHKDTVAPPDPVDVDSSSHTVDVASSDDTIVVTWTDAVDPAPASGLDGYSVEWSNASDTIPDAVIDVQDGAQTVTSDALAAGDWWFHLRTADVAGNWTSTVHLGPFTISAPLAVDFSADLTTVDVGQTVTFTDLTTGGVAPLTYAWDFDGDEVTDSALENPTYRYPTAGTYTVTLTVTDDEATARTKTKTDYITTNSADIGPRITNVGDKQFTITWISGATEFGQVNWGTVPGTLDQVATDDRGAETSDDTHHVTITGLAAENTYYFEIVSGGVTYTQTDGSPYEITTGPGLEFSMPEDLVQGTVYHQDGATPAEGTIVYLQIGTTSSQWLSAYTDVAGTWGIFITAIRYDDLHDYYPWEDIDPITLQADGSVDGSASETTTVGTAMDPGPPDMILQIGPRVTSTVPANNAVDAAVDTDIVVTFSVDMDSASAEVAFSIDPVVAGAFSWATADEMTFDPTANLATDTVYTMTISVAAEDTEGRPMTTEYSWQFTTEDTVAPSGPTDVQSTSHNASGWSNDNTIDIDWTAATDPIPGTGLDGYGIVWDTSPATIPDTNNTAAGETTATSAALADGTSHYLHIRAVDKVGNWGTTVHLGPFWVDTTAPEVLSTLPDTDAKTVLLDPVIVITFNDDMDQTLTEAAFSILPAITGIFSWGSPVLTFTPDDDFLYSTTYAVTIDVGATDKAGNTLAAEYTWNFTTPVLGRIDITPANPTVALGLTQQFTATGVRTDSTTLELIGADNWESSNTARAIIDAATGLATTLEQGSTVMSTWADDPIAGRIYGRVTLTVGAPVLTGIRIEPVDPVIALGRTQQFAVVGVYSDASEADLTSLVVYSSSNEAVATMNSAGLATSLTEGATTIGAAYGAFTDETTLTVGPPVAVALVITPVNPRAALAAAPDNTLQFTATVHNSDGSTEDVTGEATWDSDDELVATIGLDTGLVTIVGQGSTGITATVAGLAPEGTTLTVTAPTLQSIEIDDVYESVDGAAPPVQAGNTLQLFLTGTYSDASDADQTAAAVWSSSDRTVATVSTAGLVTAVSRGTATVTASHSGERDTIEITVTEPPTVAASGATDIGADSATLNGNLVDMGSAATIDISFEWGITSGALDQETTARVMTSTAAFSADLTGLAADTDFFFRAKAVGDGTTYSAEQTFKTGTTPPTVTTGAATDVTGTTAILNGSLDDLGTSADVDTFFEWGLTTAYGNETAATADMNDVGNFTVAIDGLLPSTTYHYRAKGVGSLAYGADMTFVTETVLVSIAVTPEDSSVPDGITRQYTAIGTYSNSTTRVITADVTWSSLQPTIASIDTDGLATGESPGAATIQAALGGVTGNTTLTVTAPVLTVIDVTPADPTVDAGRTQQFTATGTYSDGTTGVNVTGIVTWSSSTTGVASIDAAGLATSYNEGTTVITATGSAAGTTTLTVTAAELASIAVTPDGATIVHTGTQQYRAMGTYTDGSVIDVTNDPGITWASSNEGFATINTTGLATSVAQGAAVISASIGAVSSNDTAESAALNVTEAQLQSIAVTLATPSVAAGKTYQFTATGTYTDASTAILTGSVTWHSSNTAAAVINAAGLATSYAPGTTTITASLGGKTGQATLTVTNPELDNIVVTPADPTITFVSGNPPPQQFRATGNYSDGSTVDLTIAVTWDSSNGGVATIGTGTGLATTTGDGTTTVTATHAASGKSGNTTLIVLPDTVAPVVTLTSPIKGMILSDKTLTVSGSVDDANVVTLVAIIDGDTASPINLLPLDSDTFSQGVLLNTGSNTVLVRAVDGSGNTGSSRTVTVEVDPNKPAIMVTSPEGGTLTNNPAATVTGTITNAESATLILNGLRSTIDIEEDGTFSDSITLSEGTNVIVVNACTTGHEGDDDYLGTSGVIQVTLDTTPPVVTVDSPTSASIVSTAGAVVTGSIDDPGVTTALLILNGAAPQQIPVVGGTFSQNITLVPGVNSILVIATDMAGNTSPSTSPTTVDFDNTKPRVTITSPTNRAVVKVAGQMVTGTVEDPSIVQATLLVNGTGQIISIAPDGSFNRTVTLLEGDNTIEVTAADAALNTGTSGVVTVTVDITPPVLTIGLSDPTGSITVTVTSDEPLQAIPTVTINPAVTMTQTGINQWGGTYGSVAVPIAAGNYTVTITGTDVAGNITTRTATFAKEQIDVSPDNPATVTTETTTLEVETTGAVEDADISVTSHLENPSGNVGNPAGATQGAGAFLEIIASPELRDNLAQIYIRVDYNEEDLPPGTDESSLRLYVWDVATGVWKLVPASGVNTVDDYIYGTVDHLSEFGGFGRPTPAPDIPVPPPRVKPGVTDVTAKRTASGMFTETILALSDDGKVGITIGEGVTGLNAIDMPINAISVVPMVEPPVAPTETNIIGLAYDIGPDGARFDEAVTICFTYESAGVPVGINEENLVIAFWDVDAAAWVELDTITVNTTTHTICGQTTHFTTFAVFAHTSPASFTVSQISVSPAAVNVGQQVSISAVVTNTGDLEGTYTVILKVEDATAGSEQVTLAGGVSQTVTFTTSKSVAGAYSVSIDGQTGIFTVRESLAAAKFSVGDLSITPGTVRTGEQVTISILVSNTGDRQGSYDVQLKIDGQVVETQSITLTGGNSQTVTFTTTQDTAGTYSVTVDTRSGSFTVTKPAVVTPTEEVEVEVEEPAVLEPVEEEIPFVWWPYAAAAAVVILGALALVMYLRFQV